MHLQSPDSAKIVHVLKEIASNCSLIVGSWDPVTQDQCTAVTQDLVLSPTHFASWMDWFDQWNHFQSFSSESWCGWEIQDSPNLSAAQFRFYSTTCEVMIAYRMHPRLAQRALGHSTQRPLHGPCSQLKGGYRHFCILPKFLLDIIYSGKIGGRGRSELKTT